MTNNDILRSVRFMLNLSDAKVVEIFALTDCEVALSDVQAWLKKEDDAAFKPLPDVLMGYFLNGLIFFRRGKSEEMPAPSIERRMNNNIFMKKLRIAFDLKTTDIPAVLEKANFSVSQAEIGAIFRKPDHKNYRECGDQIMRNFLKGLTMTLRPTQPAKSAPSQATKTSPTQAAKSAAPKTAKPRPAQPPKDRK
ncbi:DUF1456 domain-containing protein [Pantoea sp. FDAARGOS_194]|nr:DUF1456 domain-containing protein [Pantoea sp. FDAARGOS_194]